VHLFGNVAPIAEIEALGVPVLEDAAQAAGSIGPDGRPGALGTAATFSFYPSKNLGAFGDAGAITTSDADIAERVRALRFHGSRDKQTFEEIGYNSRLDELQAAILRVQLPHLDAWADGRRASAGHYAASGLGDVVSLPVATPGSQPAWHLYVIRSERADELEMALRAAGIEARSYYRRPIHLQPAMYTELDLPGTAEAASSNLALPISPVLSAEQIAEIVAVLGEASFSASAE
jgi:dTDP-4-amino-4,6-dideoxygalactose transaminase